MPARIRIRDVLEFLDLDAGSLLEELRREGLFETDELSPGEADELRVAVALMHEMGVNPAGVDVALHLRRRLLYLEDRLRRVLRDLGSSRDFK